MYIITIVTLFHSLISTTYVASPPLGDSSHKIERVLMKLCKSETESSETNMHGQSDYKKISMVNQQYSIVEK